MKGWFVALALVVGAPMTLQAADATVVVLHQESLLADQQRLIEALLIYTRDLESRVITRGSAPTAVDGDSLEHIASEARASGTNVVLWAQRRDDHVAVFYLFNAATGVVRETEIGDNGVEPAAVEVALKVRAILSSRRSAPAPVAFAPPAPTAPAPIAVVAAPSVQAPPAPRFTLGAGFHVASPTDPTWLRLGLLIEGAVRLGSGPSRYWLYLDGAFTSRPRSQTAAFDATVRDLPFGAGVQALWSPRPFTLALGTRTSVHVLDVDATSAAGKAGFARRYAMGLGGVGRAELGLGRHTRAALTVLVEGLVPAQDFSINQRRAFGTGSVLFGATTGVIVELP